MKRIAIYLIVLFVLGLFAGTLWFLYSKSREPQFIYETVQPQHMTIIRKTIATGTIMPRREVALKSQVPGVIDLLTVEEGQTVEVGQLVARVRIIPNMVSLNGAEAQLQAAQINFDDAKRELKRHEQLFNDKVISEFDLDRYRLSFRLAKQNLFSAQDNLDLIREGAARNSNTASNLVHSTVTGMVLDIPVKEGSFIIETNSFNEGTTIATVADMGEMIFEGKVDEAEVGRIAPGMKLAISVGAIEDETFDAELEFISPKGEEDQGAVKFDIRAAIELKETTFLRAGFSATADIVLDRRDDVLAIREADLIFDDKRTYVDIHQGNQAFERREVKTGISDGIHIEILGGLSADETIRKQ